VAKVNACFKQLAHGELWKSHVFLPFRFNPGRGHDTV